MNNLEKYFDHLMEQKPAVQQVSPEPSSANSPELIKGILRRWYIVFLVFFIMCTIGLPAIWLLIEPFNIVTGAIRVAPILTNVITGEADHGEISNYQMFMQTQAEIMLSEPVLQRVADDLTNKNLSFFDNESEDLATKLSQKLKSNEAKSDELTTLKRAISKGIIDLAPARQTELIKLTMKSKKPEEAKQIVDTFIKDYMAVEVTSTAQDRDRNLNFLEDERKVLAEKLQSRHKQITELASEYGTTNLISRQDTKWQRINTLLSELTKIEALRISLESQHQFIEEANKPSFEPEALLRMQNEYIKSDPMIQELTKKITDTEQELIVAKQMLKSRNPALKQKQQLLDSLKTHLEEKRQESLKNFQDIISNQTANADKENLLHVQAELERTKLHETRLRQVLVDEETQTKELGRTQLNIQDLQFQLEFDQQMYDTVQRRIRELELERKRPARISVAYNASIVSEEDKRIKYSTALLFGALACGCGLAILIDKTDQRLRTPDDITKRTSIPIIGTTTSLNTIKPSLFPAQIAGDYQTIRANLGLSNGEGIPKKLVIASPGMQDGKTTFAINLATSLSKSGKKVLLIDGDFRKPDIAHLLKLPKEIKTLQDVLSGAELDKAICSVPAANLDVLASRSNNPTDAYELITSPMMAHLIDSLSHNYDHLIIDTPPILAFPDALVWAKTAGAVILTCFAGHTKAQDLKEAKDRLQQTQAKILGTVLGNVQAGFAYNRHAYKYYNKNGGSKTNHRIIPAEHLLADQNSKK